MSLASEFSKWRDFKGMACQLPRFASSQNSFPASSWIIEGLSRGPTNSSGTPRLPEVVEQWESWTSHVLMHPKCCLYTLLAQAAMLTAQAGRLGQAQSACQLYHATVLLYSTRAVLPCDWRMLLLLKLDQTNTHDRIAVTQLATKTNIVWTCSEKRNNINAKTMQNNCLF